MFESIDVDRVAMPANRTRGVRNDSGPRGYLNRQPCTRVLSRGLHGDLSICYPYIDPFQGRSVKLLSMGYPFRLCAGQVRELQGLR